MEDLNGKLVDGFMFVDRENGDIAREEIQRINYISSKINEDNPKAILSVYNKMIESKTFVTPVGLEYLRQLQSYLYKKSEIDDSQISDIPVVISYTEALGRDKDNERSHREKRRTKTFKREYKTSLMVNLVLALMIIAMFLIILKSDTPNMINYRNAITNEYAQWEQELTEREANVRAREAELE